MTKDQFLDNLFEDCGDALLDKDINTIMDYFEKHYRDVNTDDFESVFIPVIRNIMDKSDLEKYKQRFGYFLYLYFASLFEIQDIYIDQQFKDNKFDSWYWKIYPKAIEHFIFKKVTLENVDEAPVPFECDQLIITGNNIRNPYDDASNLDLGDCKAKTIIFNKYVKRTAMLSCKTIYFDENSVIYDKKNIPVLIQDFRLVNSSDLEKVILPPVDYVQVPRWICSNFHSNKVTIYKRTGQKITIFSKQGEWIKEHVKSV